MGVGERWGCMRGQLCIVKYWMGRLGGSDSWLLRHQVGLGWRSTSPIFAEHFVDLC